MRQAIVERLVMGRAVDEEMASRGKKSPRTLEPMSMKSPTPSFPR